MDTVLVLLKELKKKGIINDIEKAKKETLIEKIAIRTDDDLFIRDAIMGVGTILKEDLQSHYYITSVKTGLFGNVLSYAIIHREDSNAEIVAYAHEGLIKQHFADKTIQKLKDVLS